MRLIPLFLLLLAPPAAAQTASLPYQVEDNATFQDLEFLAQRIRTLNLTVYGSSVTLGPSGVNPGTYGSASEVGVFTVQSDGRVTFAANQSILIAEGAVTGLTADLAARVLKAGDTMTGTLNLTGATSFINTQSSVNASAFFGDGSGLTNIAAATASNLAGGLANEVPFQLSPGVTTFTGQPGANTVLFSNGSFPTWTAAPTLIGTTFSGIPAGAIIGGPMASSVLPSTVAYASISNTFTPGQTFSGLISANGGLTLGLNQTIIQSGPTGTYTGASSVTASAFFGYGGQLSGVPCKTGSGPLSVLCSGLSNSSIGDQAVVSGGAFNSATGNYSFSGGGTLNQASAYSSVIVGGVSNEANGDVSAVLGGRDNKAIGLGSSVGGGELNEASGDYSSTPGGYGNLPQGDYSFAAGRLSLALSDGSFVWADNHNAQYSDHGVNTVNFRAIGGVYVDSGSITSQYGINSATATIGGGVLAAGDGLTVNSSSVTVGGVLHIGHEMITNACGAGVTTCSATCSAGNVLTGGGCTALAALLQDGPNSNVQWGCTALSLTTITAYAFCGRFSP